MKVALEGYSVILLFLLPNLFIVSVLCCRYYNNAYYAKVGGVTTAEMNRLEMEFLFRLDFRLQVTVKVFEDYCAHLEREVMLGGNCQVDRSLAFGCGLDGVSDAQQAVRKDQVVDLRYSYGGL